LIIPDADHQIMLDQPTLFSDALLHIYNNEHRTETSSAYKSSYQNENHITLP